MPKMDWRWIKDMSEMTKHISSTSKLKKKKKNPYKVRNHYFNDNFFGEKKKKKSLFPTLQTDTVMFWSSSATGVALLGFCRWAVYAGFFWVEERRGGAAAVGREQATNTHSGTFHDPDATSRKHQSLHPLEFPTAVSNLYLYLQNECHTGNQVS